MRDVSRRLSLVLVVLGTSSALPALARQPTQFEKLRKTTEADLAVPSERVVLANGLTLVIAPDATSSSVLVSMTFQAGTLHEPAERSGLAHLVEHLMAAGPTPQTSYAALLEERHARFFNAFTGYDSLSFEVVVPAEELPVALWVAADRLTAIPPFIDQAYLDRNRRIVVEERAVRTVDEPYGLVDELLYSRLFAGSHPLHGGVIGRPDELAKITVEDAKAYVGRYLVAANAVLIVAGRCDPAAVKRLVEAGLGTLPPGTRAEVPKQRPITAERVDKRVESLSRQPRVTLAWRFPDILDDHAAALELGAQLLSSYIDGAWGMRMDASFSLYQGEGAFRMDVTLPYDEPERVALADADGFLRMLTRREMPDDLVAASHLALDRGAMFRLESLHGRAYALARLELLTGHPEGVAEHLGRHWELESDVVRDTARVFLKRPKIIIHARPLRPRPAREERQ